MKWCRIFFWLCFCSSYYCCCYGLGLGTWFSYIPDILRQGNWQRLYRLLPPPPKSYPMDVGQVNSMDLQCLWLELSFVQDSESTNLQIEQELVQNVCYSICRKELSARCFEASWSQLETGFIENLFISIPNVEKVWFYYVW